MLEVKVTVDFSEDVKKFLSGVFKGVDKATEQNMFTTAKTAEAKTAAEDAPEKNKPATENAEERPKAELDASGTSKDDIIAVLKSIGKDKAKAALEHFGAARVSELDPAIYDDFMAYARKV